MEGRSAAAFRITYKQSSDKKWNAWIIISILARDSASLQQGKPWVMRGKFECVILHELPKESADNENFPLRTQLSDLDRVYRQ